MTTRHELDNRVIAHALAPHDAYDPNTDYAAIEARWATLTGSPKQIAFARQIRWQYSLFRTRLAPALLAERSAEWWIAEHKSILRLYR